MDINPPSLPLILMFIFPGFICFSVIAVVVLFSGNKAKFKIAAICFAVGILIDFGRWELNHLYWKRFSDVFEQRRKLAPITDVIDNQIKSYVTISNVAIKASHFPFDDTRYKATHLTMVLNAKKAGNYQINGIGKYNILNTPLKEGENTIELEGESLGNICCINEKKLLLKISYESTYRKMYGDDYPSIKEDNDANIDSKHNFEVMNGFIPISELSYYE